MTVRNCRIAAAVAGATAIVLGSAACGVAGTGNTSPGGGIAVVASTDVWGSVVRAIGGDAVDVTSIIDDPTKDPHDYEVKPLDAAKIAGAALVVGNGDGYDDFFAKAVSASGGGKRSIVAAAYGPSGARANEHLFYDLPTVKRVAAQVAKELDAIRPAKESTFDGNAKQFEAEIDKLSARVATIGADHPGKQVMVTEPVASYLLKAAGVGDATPEAFERAVEAGSDIPAAALSEADGLVTGKRVAALVNNAQAETAVTKELKAKAEAAGLPIVDVTETLVPRGTDYVSWIRKEVDALSNALAKP